MTRHVRAGDAFKRRQMAGTAHPRLCTHCFREMSSAWPHPMHRACMEELLRRYDGEEPEGSPPVHL
jgi:hypothetical protein